MNKKRKRIKNNRRASIVVEQSYDKSNILITILFVLLSALIVYVGKFGKGIIGYCEIAKFYYSHSRFFQLVPIGIILLLGLFIGSFLIKGNDLIKVINKAIIPMIFIFISILFENKGKESFISDNRNIVTLGVVNKKNRTKLISTIGYYFMEDTKKKYGSDFSKGYYKFIEKGDTILIQYVKSCPIVSKVYSFKATKEEKDKCKNGCYLIEGELVPIEKKLSKN